MKKTVAILATHGFEESELKSPKEHLEQHGLKVDIIAPEKGAIRAWAEKDWGKEYEVNKVVSEATAEDYDALVLPGGVINPDKLRVDESAIRFIRTFFEKGKAIAAICHGPQLLIETGMISGRVLTSVKNISTDLKNAGAKWLDREVVVDGNLISSRTPEDLPAFNKELLAAVGHQVNAGE